MNSRRVQNSIAELQKDINNCELLVTSVNDKVDKSKSDTLKCDNSTRERSVMTHVTAPLERGSLSPPCKLNSQKSSNRNSLLCKEVFKNNNATVEVTVKARSTSIDKSRKRLRSNIFSSAAETDGTLRNDQKKQSTNNFDPHPPSKVNRKGNTVKKVLSTKNKHLSWDRILKDSKAPCNVHDSKGKKFASKAKSLHKSLCADPVNNTESDRDSICYKSRSVQCHLLEDNVHGAVKHETNPPTNKPSDIGLSAGNDGYSTFSVYNPVRILHFLIKELNSKIKNCDDENLQRIFMDMEEALTRISPESNNEELKENINIPVRDTSKPTNLGFIPIKPAEPSHSKNVLIQKTVYPEQKLRDISQKQKSVSVSKPSESVSLCAKNESETHILLSGLETKCINLESNLHQLEKKYEKQRKEKESLIEQVKSLEQQLESVISRENDYLTTIGYLKSNLQTMKQRMEEQAKCISELTTNNNMLKEENKALTNLHEREVVLEKHLKNSTEKEDKIHAELQIMRLEQEKFHTLLAGKNSEVHKLKQELRDIQSFVSKQLSNLKSQVFGHKNKKVLDESFIPGKQSSPTIEDSDVDSVAFFDRAPLLNGGRGNDKPICSSPTSSIPSSSGINSSWQKISRISSSSLILFYRSVLF